MATRRGYDCVKFYRFKDEKKWCISIQGHGGSLEFTANSLMLAEDMVHNFLIVGAATWDKQNATH